MRVGVLASGTGSNLQALIDGVHGRDGIELVAVGSDRPEAPALERARRAGIEVGVFPRSEYADRDARDAALVTWLRERGVGLVVLAGYTQLVSGEFLDAFPEQVINVHPALLPAFPGLHVVQAGLDYGVKVFGVTVHFVDSGVDTGPVIFQRAVELPDARTVDEVLDVLHPIEHELLVTAVRLFAAGRLRFDPANPRRVLAR
ncbi:MAG TPA: phosphoribosylglycinamide formyltransferase [Solirubrobacteraceae bacterium]